MISFKQFLNNKLKYLVSYFQKQCVLLDYNGNLLKEIDLSFDTLSDQYISFCQQEQRKNTEINSNNILTNISYHLDPKSSQQLANNMHSINLNQKQLNIKITDRDLQQFWNNITPTYDVSFNIENQNISDQSVLKLAELYQNQMCRFTKLKLKGNSKITQIGVMKLGQALRSNKNIKQINLNGLSIGSNGINRIIELIGVTNVSCLDLGHITNESLKYLAKNLESHHSLDSLWFSEVQSGDKWKDDGKLAFQNVIRRCQVNKRILAINVYLSEPINHYSFISELNILTKKNRNLRIDQRQNEFKAASLNPNHHSYYDPDNHNLNAYKFSVKSYLTNVFGSTLDEALYFLQKQRRNQLRDQATFEITNQPTNKVILQDICTADGSIIVLTKYLLSKIKEKEKEQNIGTN